MKKVSTEAQIQTENTAQKTTGIKTDRKRESRQERKKKVGTEAQIQTEIRQRKLYKA